MSDYKRKELDFYSTIITPEFSMDNVRCRIYLPVKVADEIEVVFYPTQEQAKGLEAAKHLFVFSIKAEIKDFFGVVEETIFSEKILFRKLIRKSLAVNVSYSELHALALDLRITRHLNYTDSPEAVEGNFWITYNPLLRTSYFPHFSRLGEIRFKDPKNFKIKVDDATKLKFEDVYISCKNEHGDNVHFFETIASFQINGETGDSPKFKEIFNQLEDILLLTSFATRHRCYCFGWTIYDGKENVTQYLRDKAKPSDSLLKKSYNEDGVIGISDFEKFMRDAYKGFIAFPDKDILRRIMNFVIPNDKGTIESEFVTLYSALEMLVSHYRKNKDLEFILKSNQFNKVRKKLKTSIEELKLQPIQMKRMQEKLSELNRVSFSTAFEQFCKNYKVNLQDLWSITDNSDGITLSQIRNRLVHGEHFTYEETRALPFAKDQLRWTVERMILGVLKFPVSKTLIHSSCLGHYYSYTDKIKYQKILTK
jgi:hypothetical protein